MSRRPALILIMAGGTGGHIFPGLAVAAALIEAGAEVRWLGASGGMECNRVPPVGIALDEVHITALRGKGVKSWLAGPFRLVRAVLEARSAMGRHRPDCAVSFGGYVAGPGGIAAWLKGIPLVVHEQNRIPGLTNRVLARLAKQVLQAFPNTFRGLDAETCGNPVRRPVAVLGAPEERWRERIGPPRLLVTGGSQGAHALNRLLPAAVRRLEPRLRPIVRHQSGSRDELSTREAYGKAGIEAEVVRFIEDMAAAYAWADVVVCRAGALTVSELAAAGLGAILVPFPHAVDDHQTANARFLADADAAVVVQEADLTAEVLAACLEPLLEDRGRTLEMARAARRLAVPDSAQRVAQACLRWVTV